MDVLVENRKLVKDCSKKGYMLYSEEWKYHPTEEPTVMIGAYSSIDGSYIGDEKTAKMLNRKFGILPQSIQGNTVSSIGFSQKDNKWYGWSHRAIFGFGLGSTCKKGDCHYIPSNRNEYIDDLKLWYSDDMYKNVDIKEEENGIRVKYEIHQQDTGNVLYTNDLLSLDVEYGKGEWIALDMEDAKQMAIDFAKGVS